MIAETSPLVTAVAVAAVVGTSMFATKRPAADPGQLSGVLYAVDTDSRSTRTAAASMPEIYVGLDPAARTALPPATALIVRFVGVDESTFTLTLSRSFQDASSITAAAAARKRSRRPALKAMPAVAAVEISTPVAALVVAPPPTPKPTFPPTFAEIDDALQASSTAQAINVRVKKGGLTFRLTHVGRVADHYVIRYAIANEDPDAFFLSVVNVSADGKPVHSETAGAYSCRTGQEVYGVVHFVPAAVAGKKVVVELVQSGGDHRRFSLTADYAF